ncbi:Acyltransferase protein [Lasiodiplodia theobromae]|uniref:Acyltransferase protein n=1 Tax=Lasiodiplodia theobromae TaxID=45133 RepID=UPI0015C34BDB|nr:Acyltransferase protein [Lasiodiplodia theobromae]KAF4546546.1 Acyltransferase protein [Lasiodiplodia theobromae]
MYGGYQRVPSGIDGPDVVLPGSPGPSSPASESSFNEKQPTADIFQQSFADVSVKLRAYGRSRGRWLYDISRCVGGTALAPVLPSFLRPRATSEGGAVSSGSASNVNSISTLDGVRGYACFFVFNFHFLFMYTSTVNHGYGSDPSQLWIHQLPIIKILYCGRAMVSVFFVLSGYVLSRKPLMALRSQSYDSMLQTLSSSIFRRGIRLFLPTLISTFIILLIVRTGWFQRGREVGEDGVTLAFFEHHVVTYDTWQEQAWDYFNFIRNYIDFTNWGEWYNLYDPHVWTIPLEYRASMVLFLNLICLSRARTAWRLAFTVSFIIFCARWARFEVVLFLSGSLLAELDLITNTWGTPAHRQPSFLPVTTNPITPPLPAIAPISEKAPAAWSSSSSSSPVHSGPLTFFHLSIFTLALYLLSYPDDFANVTPGYVLLSEYMPDAYRPSCPYRFWQSVGAVLALYAVCNCRPLRRPFQTPLAQYLGSISYAFYLVHGPVLHSVGLVLMRAIFKRAGRYNVVLEQVPDGLPEGFAEGTTEGLPEGWPMKVLVKMTDSGQLGNMGFVGCLFVGYVVLLTMSVWLADLFWRAVDIPVVKLARALENKVRKRD